MLSLYATPSISISRSTVVSPVPIISKVTVTKSFSVVKSYKPRLEKSPLILLFKLVFTTALEILGITPFRFFCGSYESFELSYVRHHCEFTSFIDEVSL